MQTLPTLLLTNWFYAFRNRPTASSIKAICCVISQDSQIPLCSYSPHTLENGFVLLTLYPLFPFLCSYCSFFSCVCSYKLKYRVSRTKSQDEEEQRFTEPDINESNQAIQNETLVVRGKREVIYNFTSFCNAANYAVSYGPQASNGWLCREVVFL